MSYFTTDYPRNDRTRCGHHAHDDRSSSSGGSRNPAEAIESLASALHCEEEDPKERVLSLSVALYKNDKLYQELIKRDPKSLTEDEQEVIALYQTARCEVLEILSTFEDFTSLFDELLFREDLLIPGKSRAEAMQDFIKFFLEIVAESQRFSATVCAAYFDQQLTQLEASAKKCESEGEKLHAGGIAQGVVTAASGALQLFGGWRAGSNQFKASTRAVEIEKKTAALKLETDPKDQFKLQQNIDAVTRKSINNNKKVTYHTAGSQGFQSFTNATGQITAQEYNLDAKKEESEKIRAQTRATVADQGKNQTKEISDRSQKNSETMLEAYKTALQAENEQLNLAARA